MPKTALLALCLPLLAAPVVAQTVADPYLPGLRWLHGSDPVQPWIPRDLALAGDEGHVWVGQAVGTPGAALYAGVPGAAPQLLSELSLPGAIGEVHVAAGALDELFLAAQFPSLSGARVTEVRRVAVQTGSPAWTRTLAPTLLGGVELALAGDRLFAARFDPVAGRVHLDRLDPTDGATLAATSFTAPALRGLTASADGSRLLVGLGTSLRLVDADLGTLLDVPLTASTEAFDLSDDGAALAHGAPGEVRLWRDHQGSWAPAEVVWNPGPWLAASLDLDATGDTLGVGWWDQQTGASVLFQHWDLAAGVKLHELLQSTPGTGLQNFPEEVRLSADGDRMACGAWGSGGPDPQLLLLDRDEPLPLLATYLPGSVLALDLDADGGRLALAVKGAHNNQFATTGFVQLHDLGERDVRALGPLTSPGSFHLTSRQAGSIASLYAFGAPAAPAAYPGIAGSLALDPNLPVLVLPAPADASGRADLTGPIPANPAYLGMELGCQVVFVVPAGLAFSERAPLLTVLVGAP